MKHGGFLLSLCLFVGAVLASAGQANSPEGVSDAVITGDGMPRDLAEYGFFRDAAGREPALGVIPYRLNTPLFSDGAEKLRYVYVPQGKTAISAGEGLLQFPVGSALIKTFAFGEGDEQQFIETRVLLHRAEGWVALPYRWNAEQTQARLALAGARTEITTPSGDVINYRVPNKNQCKQCHSIDDAVVPIGPKARNLSGDWLAEYASAGHLDSVPEDADTLPQWEQRADVPLNMAARAYLDVNCAHCHMPQGKASNSGLDLRWEQDDPTALGIRKRPVAAGRGSGGLNFSIVPGDPSRSIMVHRMGSDNPGVAMPELGKSTVDHEGLAIIESWIAEMEQ